MSEPVTNGHKLPPAVLALLGDDATPETALADLQDQAEHDAQEAIEWSGRVHPDSPENYGDIFAGTAYQCAIAAAAIRAMEATIARQNAREGHDDLNDLIQAEMKAAAEYADLRSWRVTGHEAAAATCAGDGPRCDDMNEGLTAGVRQVRSPGAAGVGGAGSRLPPLWRQTDA